MAGKRPTAEDRNRQALDDKINQFTADLAKLSPKELKRRGRLLKLVLDGGTKVNDQRPLVLRFPKSPQVIDYLLKFHPMNGFIAARSGLYDSGFDIVIDASVASFKEGHLCWTGAFELVPVEDAPAPLTISRSRTNTSSNKARAECERCLREIMKQSPNEPTKTKSELYREALAKWPNLSTHSFDFVWRGVTAEYAVWLRPGAPKGPRPKKIKSPHHNPRIK